MPVNEITCPKCGKGPLAIRSRKVPHGKLFAALCAKCKVQGPERNSRKGALADFAEPAKPKAAGK